MLAIRSLIQSKFLVLHDLIGHSLLNQEPTHVRRIMVAAANCAWHTQGDIHAAVPRASLL